MPNRLTERFVEALNSGARDEGSVYYRAANMTNALLVVDEEHDAKGLVEACFENQFPVAVVLVRHDPSVPRIETESESIVGEPSIRKFLESRA